MIVEFLFGCDGVACFWRLFAALALAQLALPLVFLAARSGQGGAAWASGWIDRMNAAVGRAASWLVLIIAVAQSVTVAGQFLFGESSKALEESAVYAHAILFLFAIPWTLARDGHVRVDIVQRNLSPRGKAVVDLMGVYFLLTPTAAALIWFGRPYVEASWASLERSAEAGGLPFVYLLKSAMLAAAALLLLQGAAQAARATRAFGKGRAP